MPANADFESVGLPRDAEGPVFDYPWQAHAFALVMRLYQGGAFTWEEWVRVFSGQIAAAPEKPGESTNDAYYRQWLAALEEMVARTGLADAETMARRKAEWRQAYLNTPHGTPVALANAARPPEQAEEHLTTVRPVAVNPALH